MSSLDPNLDTFPPPRAGSPDPNPPRPRTPAQGPRQWVMLLTLLLALLPAGGRALAADVSIYADALAAGWSDWSWDTSRNFAATSPVHGGTRALSTQFTAAWAGLYLHADAAYNTTSYDRLSFWIHGGTAGNQRLVIVANGDGAHTVAVTATANTWTQVVIPFSQLGGPAGVTELYWHDSTGGPQPVFYLDDIQLLASNAPPPPPPSLSIDAGANRHAISEDIYGMNYADESLAAELRLPVRRWGGNATTRYNWRTSMTNKASDWYFETLPEGTVNPATLPNGSASDQFVDQDRRTGTRSLLTVPLLGWTAKSNSPRNHPYDCGFKVTKYGAQQSVDPWDTACGNGLKPDGSKLTGNDPNDANEAIGADFVTGWVNHLVARYGSAAQKGVAYYDLDNEPMLWNSTHRDVHPNPATYDELRDRTYLIAPALKAADPSAKTLGPVLWGWCAYLYSAKDGCGPGADYQAHGNQPFVPWYLGQMKTYEQQHQLRILDYLDLHYYPQENGVALSSAGGAATQALRLRSTRSLWDSTYVDESWISDTATGGVKIRLIPRMRDWVNTYYPGTRLAITEYNWGGLESLNGALAQADVLGIFGREGLDLATLWDPPASAQPGAYAFRLYRNYDGAGHGFGDVGVAAASSQQDVLAVYAAERSADHALTLVVINKGGTDLTSPVGIKGVTLPASAQVYRYGASNLAAIVRAPNQPLTASGFTATFPANSISLYVLTPAGSSTATLTVTKAGTGAGGVTASSGSLSWNGATGTASYPVGTALTLTATAATGSTFSGWTGCDSASGTSCTLALGASRAVTANFTLNRYPLTVKASGTGSGGVVASVGGINFSYPATSSAAATLDYGTAVTLTATATNGATPAWSGSCDATGGSGSSKTCTVNSMTAARSVAASFTALACTYSLTPASKNFAGAGGSGSVSVKASATACAWTAKSNVAWVTLATTSYTGSATVAYTVAKNTSGASRTGTLTLAGQTFTVTQSK